MSRARARAPRLDTSRSCASATSPWTSRHRALDSHHYAFAVDDEAFDAIHGRIQAAGLQYSADPGHRRPGELNDNDGGRGLYVYDPDGHNLEFLTRPITGET